METLFLFIGLIIGSVLTKLICKPRHAGTLRTYEDSDDGSVYFYLDLDSLPEEIIQCEYVTFKVSRK